jgi:hypothetical protein
VDQAVNDTWKSVSITVRSPALTDGLDGSDAPDVVARANTV